MSRASDESDPVIRAYYSHLRSSGELRKGEVELRSFRMRIIKCATPQAARWHSIYEQSLTSSSPI